ncbi:nicotinate-nucleotide--dimethylbenzimidazole phosphoribosyltransferase, partial [Allorhizocola rhizosphaerae]|uniref:nicotinate-nucleotide--dimethylbenzimidazole phosphoribosyltransferase n=1 Tax=Allorhizocola rhizosphaerae TaxID=1872709 RepID=UPI001B8D6CFA
GQPTVLKKGRPAPAPKKVVQQEALTEQTQQLPIVQTGLTVIAPGMDLPVHDDDARSAARHHLSNLDIRRAGLGALAQTVVFAAGTQSKIVPQAWERPHMFLLHGVHEGDIAAGDSTAVAALQAEQAQRGEGPIGLLATWNGVSLKVVEAETADDMAYGRAASPETIEAMLNEGMRLADEAVDSGADLIILGSCGAGAEATAAAIVARITGAEIATLLGRIVGPDGSIDDSSWMLRCAAARDALHRVRNHDLLAKTLLSELAGADFAVAVGIVLGATARRTAVLMDGPVATASALLARDLGSQSRLWCALPDHGEHPTTKAAADVLGLTPILDLKVDLGEGATSLLALPLLRAGLHLSAALDTKPAVIGADEPR